VVATVHVGDAASFYQRKCAEQGSVHSFMGTTFNVRRCDLPSAVGAGAGAVWVTQNDVQAIARIDPQSNRITAVAPVGVVPFEVAVTAGAVWVTSYQDDAIVRVDPQTRKVVASIRQPGQGPSGIAVGSAVWVTDSRAGTVTRIDRDSNAVTAVIPLACRAACAEGPKPLAIAVTDGAVWVRNEGDATVARINPATNQVVATMDVDAFYGRDGVDAIAVTPGGVWLTGIQLQLIDPHANRVVSRIDLTGITLAWGNGSLWVTDILGRMARIQTR
jgi:DNA-binding beta-propeller fold protein YncE